MKKVKAGSYSDPEVIVGPLTEHKHLERVKERIQFHQKWVDESVPGRFNPENNIVEPVIIAKPLSHGGNYEEFYAPVFFIQKFEKDEDLKLYFENTHYIQNAGYVTVLDIAHMWKI